MVSVKLADISYVDSVQVLYLLFLQTDDLFILVGFKGSLTSI